MYQKWSVAIGLLLYLPLGWQILTSNVKHKVTQNIASFMLWALLDFVGAYLQYIRHGNWYSSLTFAIGCTCISVCLIKAKTFAWTRFETYTSIAVLCCIAVWIQMGPQAAIVVSAIGIVISSVAQIKDAAKKPWEMPLVISACYVFVNILFLIGGKDWSIQERLIPITNGSVSLVLVVLSARKFVEVRPQDV